jgi:hypothetical protein
MRAVLEFEAPRLTHISAGRDYRQRRGVPSPLRQSMVAKREECGQGRNRTADTRIFVPMPDLCATNGRQLNEFKHLKSRRCQPISVQNTLQQIVLK